MFWHAVPGKICGWRSGSYQYACALWVALALTLWASLPGLAQAQTIAVVGHPDSGLSSLTPQQVAAIFLGKTPTLPNGVVAYPIDRGEEEAVRQVFYDTLTGKSAAEIKSYWTRLVFAGVRMPPPTVTSAQEAKALLARYPGGITYMLLSEVDAGVRPLVVLK